MATLQNLTSFKGSIGNVTAYTRRDSNEVYLRKKGGVSKKRIKTDKAFERTRESNAEWSGCAKAAAKVRDMFILLNAVTDYNLSGPLTALAKNIQLRDLERKRGERSVLFSLHGSILEGFQLNRKNTFESIIRGRLETQINTKSGTATIQLPELIPGISFVPPVKVPVFRIGISFHSLPDLYLGVNGYCNSNNELEHRQIGVYHHTQWLYTGNTVPAQSIELLLPDQHLMHPQDALALSIAVSFGTPITDQVVKVTKYVGGGKILRVECPEVVLK